MSKYIRDQLAVKMLACSQTVRDLLLKINSLETDVKLTSEEKLSQIKNIREEISKVGTEIDNIKKEIKLLTAYNIN